VIVGDEDRVYASHLFRAAVAPHAEWLARRLLNDSEHPTPLTRKRHQAARGR
jgi:hypothetical protein